MAMQGFKSSAMGALLLIALFVPYAHTQQLLVYGSNALPACAQQCTYLSQAQAACVPPAAPATNQATYESCFCTSAYLTSLKSSPASICGTVCQGNDLNQIASWYSTTCADGGAAAAAAAAASSSSTLSTSATSAASAAGSTASAGSQTGNSASTTTSSQPQTWWSVHSKWVIMVIVIFVGLILLAITAVLLRRFHLRRKDRMKGRFNDGITTRTMPQTPQMSTTTAAVPGSSHDYYGPATPITRSLRGDSRMASEAAMARAQETAADNGVMESSKAEDSRRGRTLTKGKARATIDEPGV